MHLYRQARISPPLHLSSLRLHTTRQRTLTMAGPLGGNHRSQWDLAIGAGAVMAEAGTDTGGTAAMADTVATGVTVATAVIAVDTGAIGIVAVGAATEAGVAAGKGARVCEAAIREAAEATGDRDNNTQRDKAGRLA